MLRIKALRYPGSAAQVCAKCLQPPLPEAVARAVAELVRLEALDVRPPPRPGAPPVEELTPLGQARFPAVWSSSPLRRALTPVSCPPAH